MTLTTHIPVIARLTGRCANGAERDGGRRSHVVLLEAPNHDPRWERAVCGAKPGRLSNGWVEVDGAEQPTCPRCAARMEAGRSLTHYEHGPGCECRACRAAYGMTDRRR